MTTSPTTPDTNWESYALDMCSLLDKIEQTADDADAVRALARGRFELARQHGFDVVVTGKTTGFEQ